MSDKTSKNAPESSVPKKTQPASAPLGTPPITSFKLLSAEDLVGGTPVNINAGILPLISTGGLLSHTHIPSGILPTTGILSSVPDLRSNLITRDPEAQNLRQQILDLQNKLATQAHELTQVKASQKKRDAQLKQLQDTSDELRQKQELDFLLSRVTPAAEKAIMATDALRQQFFTDQEKAAFVVSIDIRRSTDLMLKARSPALFAAFMTQLCAALEIAIKEEFGVFDKFTGDGVLAFFPEFFSGQDAGYHAIKAAERALAIFEDCYLRNRSSFTTILRDVNLAVGIDYGSVHLVQVAGGLTVVGAPVVYACRFSSGPAGTILLNQPAYEKISEAYGNLSLISETEIEIKHEGWTTCYSLKPGNKTFEPAAPAWIGTSSAENNS